MKKGLSILLIAAALFGFYGGATNLNDVLACKDYWQAASGSSDSMQLLEDGLNQLKDNEQAYLDGVEQVAEGEETLAAGEASYAAAPGQLAAGEKALAEGKSAYSSLKSLISGLKTAQKHGVKATSKHDTYWHDAFSNALEPGRKKIEGIMSSSNYASLLGLIGKLNGYTDLTTIPARFKDTNQSYASFDKQVVATKKNFETAATVLTGYKTNLFALGTPAYNVVYYGTVYKQTATNTATAVAAGQMTQEAATAMVNAAKEDYDKAAETFKKAALAFSTAYAELNAAVPSLVTDATQKAQIQILFNAISAAAEDGTATITVPGLGEQSCAGVVYSALVKNPTTGSTESADNLKATFDGYINMLDYDDPTDKNDGYAQQFGTWDDGYNTLLDGQQTLGSTSSGIPFAFKNMVTNSTIKAAVKKYDPSLMKILKKYTGSKLKSEDFDDFDDDIVYLGQKVIPRCLKVLAKVKASAASQLAAGKKTLAEGYASYAAAGQQLADGRAALAAGKEQLAVYEDGEQQVRDGLATLVGTEAMGGLDSIADRIGNDTDFDNGDNHLELDEGLAAVDAGKGYAAELTDAVTNEITARAVGTVALLGAGVLAVLAAILSFLKKNKGAGVFAILAAAAGAFGAYYGSAAGTEFSSIAGSTVGATGWIAAGILGAVALVHAIVHFSAKKEVA